MKIRIVIAGKPALNYAKAGIEEYLKRMRKYDICEMVIVKAGDQEGVTKRLLDASQGCFRIALDERGQSLNTRQLSTYMQKIEIDGNIKTVAYMIGAADGHNQAFRDQCDMILSLSKLTMQHELALLVLVEQIYRIASIRAGTPYHRD